MAQKLTVEATSIRALLSGKDADFLIPDYQRPYAWEEDQCSALWDDLFSFAFPNDDCDQFNKKDEYFLGPIVTFKNDKEQHEVIDGQQRLTTIMLLLRAFYDKFSRMKDKQSRRMHDGIAACIWKTDEYDEPDTDELKIDSEVASDSDKDEFLHILREGKVDPKWASRYAKNFSFFQRRIEGLAQEWPSYIALFSSRIINNVILLPIEADNQDTALRIFSTLNDRGLPLSDADIFKSQFYKHFSAEGRRPEFSRRWKALEEGANEVLRPLRGTPMDELFTRYMYYRRAKLGIVDTTTQGLRDFYARDSYAILRSSSTLDDLERLLGFWQRVDARDGFSDEVLRRLAVMQYAPNGMWTYLLSVWFLANDRGDGTVDDAELVRLLDLTCAFVWAYAIERPGVNSLRTPMFPEMVNVVKGEPVTFSKHLFQREEIAARFRTFQFTNQRAITRSMLAWWAYHDPEQPLWEADTTLEVEHIYARRRAEEEPLANRANLESLGNKALLEKRVNIRAADYRFADKKKYYLGFEDAKGKRREGTLNAELRRMADERDDFDEADIEVRARKIICSFVDYLGDNGLLEG